MPCIRKPPRKTNSRAKSAPEYVAKMDYDPEKWPALSELAKRFQTSLPADLWRYKELLPSLRNRCSCLEVTSKCGSEGLQVHSDDGQW